MKKGKLTDVEKACIKGMVNDEISIMAMATQLDRGAPIIEKEVGRIKSNATKEQLFINKTAAGSQGVSIMTEAASVRGDSAKDKSNSATQNKQRSQWIHKIN